MQCPDCSAKMDCIDSRENATKSFGVVRRRRYRCDGCGARHSSCEILMPGKVNAMQSETFLRSMIGEDFKAKIRSITLQLYNLAGGT